MKYDNISRIQKAALAELARLLHLPQQSIVLLFVKNKNPLPMPLLNYKRSQFKFEDGYLKLLICWITNERQITGGQKSVGLDLDLIEQELKKTGLKLSCLDEKCDYPSCYFLG